MKKRLFLLTYLALICFYSSAQTPDYFQNNPTWGCFHWVSPFVGSTNDSFVYYLNGTVNYGVNTYHNVYKRGVTYNQFNGLPENNFDFSAQMYIRQEGRNIYYYDQLTATDRLLISYDYNVGDTMKGYILEWSNLVETVESIDSVLVGSEYRRIYYSNTDTLQGVTLIEGIGHYNHLNSSYPENIGEFLLDMSETSNANSECRLICYGQNNINMWDAIGDDQCNLTLNTQELGNNTVKTVMRIVDLTGRETDAKSNTLLIYIYTNGTTEKVFRFE